MVHNNQHTKLLVGSQEHKHVLGIELAQGTHIAVDRMIDEGSKQKICRYTDIIISPFHNSLHCRSHNLLPQVALVKH